MNIQEIIQTIRDAGISGLLIIALIGGWRKWWVFGWQYKEIHQEREEWKHLALGGTTLAERGISVAKKVVEESTPL